MGNIRRSSSSALLAVAIALLSFSSAIAQIPGLTDVGQESCNPGNACDACKGDCDTDADCAGDLECFSRDALEPVPGCSVSGDGTEGWDYCYDAVPNAGLPGLVSLGEDGCSRGSCNACEGDCDSDADCSTGLKCFTRDRLEGVPGCSVDGHGFDGWDYCYNDSPTPKPTAMPTLPGLVDLRDDCTKGSCSACEGACDVDGDCAGDLECFSREKLEAVPGCSDDGAGVEGRSYCFDASLAPQPTDRPTPMPTHSGLVNLGDNGCSRGSCNACEGDCDSDEDCAGGLRCFSREKLEAVPGCSADGDGFDGWDYCFDISMTAKPTAKPTAMPTLPGLADLRDECTRGSCSACEGACTVDADCATDLKCFSREKLEAVPGCSDDGAGVEGRSYCFDASLTAKPTAQPTPEPTIKKTSKPTPVPTERPTRSPTPRPTKRPTTSEPTSKPTRRPTTADPTSRPTKRPTTSEPTSKPTRRPTTADPTSRPTKRPTTSEPTSKPTRRPTTADPTSRPTKRPTTSEPTSKPTRRPTTADPTSRPTKRPTTSEPTSKPTRRPTTADPTSRPTKRPTTSEPTSKPTRRPTTADPTSRPTKRPTTSEPTSKPTRRPTTADPTSRPTKRPTTSEPTSKPTRRPTTADPTSRPTKRPTTSEPTSKPTRRPTTAEPTEKPTPVPTEKPTRRPTPLPTQKPTQRPTARVEKDEPATQKPTKKPTPVPTEKPTEKPTPSPKPTNKKTRKPTEAPTARPTGSPTPRPTDRPTPNPTNSPTRKPSPLPTPNPTKTPTLKPTNKLVTNKPTALPTRKPTARPTPKPSNNPTKSPTFDSDLPGLETRTCNFDCDACEGNCRNDADCVGSLSCFSRNTFEAVPGCSSFGDGFFGLNYCYEKKTPGTGLKDVSRNGCGSQGCGVCEGDCDDDSDCAENLMCSFRDRDEPILGCGSGGTTGWDYCVIAPVLPPCNPFIPLFLQPPCEPSETTQAPTARPTSSPTPARPTDPSCQDSNTNCEFWASLGECDRNPDYMLSFCTRSCDECGSGDPPSPTTKPPTERPTREPTRTLDRTESPTSITPDSNCQDSNISCEFWASLGECDRNPDYMLSFCTRSCDECGSGGGPSPTRQPTGRPTRRPTQRPTRRRDRTESPTDRPTREPTRRRDPTESPTDRPTREPTRTRDRTESPTSDSSCEDNNGSCEFWASLGECDRNPDYMLSFCARSCNGCATDGPSSPTRAPTRRRDPTESPTDRPTREPTRTRDRTESPTSDSSCEDNNGSCEFWASLGECDRNPDYMLSFCARSCNGCATDGPSSPTRAPTRRRDPTESPTDRPTREPTRTRDRTESPTSDSSCEDNNGSCEFWASLGECDRNPDYMLSFCARSCNGCATDGPSSPTRAPTRRRDPTEGPTVIIPDSSCEDNNGSCEFWASLGECDRNPDYMLSFCARSCDCP